uniref:Uncharacterized protein n=1 Tax=Rhizophora mucronata TaxID=61149 RepID=A0A2P2MQ14_RHIMU
MRAVGKLLQLRILPTNRLIEPFILTRFLVQHPNRGTCIMLLCLQLYMKFLRVITAQFLLMVKQERGRLTQWKGQQGKRMGNFQVMQVLSQGQLNKYLTYWKLRMLNIT